ncbi:MAG: NifB/NifX family molybdenum-iron cluster-binding protein [Candidatus Bathyarchaeia archaeon]
MDSETMQFEAIPNLASGAMSGAGIQAAQIIINKNVEVLITENIGPKALQALLVAGIKIVICAYGTVREAIEKYKKGELKEINNQATWRHFRMKVGRRRGLAMVSSYLSILCII